MHWEVHASAPDPHIKCYLYTIVGIAGTWTRKNKQVFIIFQLHKTYNDNDYKYITCLAITVYMLLATSNCVHV